MTVLNQKKITYQLSKKQILLIISLCFWLYIIAFLLTFPIEKLALLYADRWAQQKGLSLQVADLQISLWGKIRAKSVWLKGSSLDLSINDFSTDIAPWDLLRGRYAADIETGQMRLRYRDIAMVINHIRLEANMEDRGQKLFLLDGKVDMLIEQARILPIKNLPMVGDLPALFIKKIRLPMVIKENRLRLKPKGVIHSTIARIDAQGLIFLRQPFGYSTLNLKLCLDPRQQLFAKIPMLEMLKSIPDYKTKLCTIKIEGRLNNPKSNIKELLMPSAQ